MQRIYSVSLMLSIRTRHKKMDGSTLKNMGRIVLLRNGEVLYGNRRDGKKFFDSLRYMIQEELVQQLKGNWSRVKYITHNQRTLFERIYDCFEVIGELETGLTGGEMITALKKQCDRKESNEVRKVFDRMLGNEDFLKDLSCLKTYSPVENNTRKNSEVYIDDEKDFNTIIDVIYTIRNNLRHGKKEYNTRNEKMIQVANRIFYKIVGGARLKYLS